MILLNFDIHPELQILMILLKQSSVQKKICIDRERQFNARYIKMSKIDQCSAFEIKVFQQTFGGCVEAK